MRSADIRRLEARLADAWPAAETAHVDGWRLGFSGGATRRANAALPLGNLTSLDLETAIAEVEKRYRRHGLAPCFKMTRAALPTRLSAALDRRGYRHEGFSHVLVGDLDAAAAAESNGHAIRLLAEPTAAWSSLCLPDDESDDAVGRRAIIARLPRPAAFALTTVEGHEAGAAAATVQDGWAMIWAVRVAPAARRKGAAVAMMRTLAAWARGEGASRYMLQVGADNLAARRLYAGLGMRRAYSYHYRTLGDSGHHH